MRQLSLEELKALWVRVEAAVDATPDIDPWCTGPDWSLSVNAGFGSANERLLLEAAGGAGYALLARYETSRGTGFYGGLEPLWGFGAPIFGPDPAEVVDQLVDHLRQRTDWKALYLPGMPADLIPEPPDVDRESDADTISPSPFTMTVAEGLARLGPTRLIEGIVRQVADLSDGHEAWSARRSSRFRRNLRQARRRADEVGVIIEDVSTDPGLLDRLMAIEVRSWKGREGSGITTLEMSTMYRTMIERLGERGRLAAHVARLDAGRERSDGRKRSDEDDIGYILGGIRNRRYRGLQLSFVQDRGDLSIGNLLQDHQLRALGEPGPDGRPIALTYDLGMDFDYKRRWADGAEPSVVIVVNRGHTPASGSATSSGPAEQQGRHS